MRSMRPTRSRGRPRSSTCRGHPRASTRYCRSRRPAIAARTDRADERTPRGRGVSLAPAILESVHLLPTTLVGSYPQPEWLIDRAKLAGRFPPRVRAKELWRIPEPLLEEAQNDATLLAIKAQEEAGLHITTPGENRRARHTHRLAPPAQGSCTRKTGTAPDPTV